MSWFYSSSILHLKDASKLLIIGKEDRLCFERVFSNFIICWNVSIVVGLRFSEFATHLSTPRKDIKAMSPLLFNWCNRSIYTASIFSVCKAYNVKSGGYKRGSIRRCSKLLLLTGCSSTPSALSCESITNSSSGSCGKTNLKWRWKRMHQWDSSILCKICKTFLRLLSSLIRYWNKLTCKYKSSFYHLSVLGYYSSEFSFQSLCHDFLVTP